MGHIASIEIMGVPVAICALEELLQRMQQGVLSGERRMFSTANAHSMVLARDNPELLKYYRSVDAVLPDGMLPVLEARARGCKAVTRVSGPDFMEAALSAASRNGWSVYFMGAVDGTLARIVARCGREFPNLRVCGSLAPPFGTFTERDDDRMRRTINAANPDILFVGMTAPKQELWLSRNWDQLSCKFGMGVGAAFDFYGGTKKRAPRMAREFGFEWLYRLVREPRRMWRRNLSSVRFVVMAMAERRLRR